MSVQRTFLRDDEAVTVKAEPVGGDHWRVHVGDREYEFRVAPLGDGGVRLVPVWSEAAPACVAYGVAAGRLFMVPESRPDPPDHGDGSGR